MGKGVDTVQSEPFRRHQGKAEEGPGAEVETSEENKDKSKEKSHQEVKHYGTGEGAPQGQKPAAGCAHSTSAASSATFIPH